MFSNLNFLTKKTARVWQVFTKFSALVEFILHMYKVAAATLLSFSIYVYIYIHITKPFKTKKLLFFSLKISTKRENVETI